MKQKNTKYRIGIITMVTLLVLAGGAYFYVAAMHEMIRGSVMDNLKGIVELTKRNVSVKIADNLDSLLSIATLLENQESDDIEKLTQSMEKTATQNMYLRMGIAGIDGNAVTTDNQTFSIADRAYFDSAIKGEPSVSNMLDDRVSGEKIQVYAVPLYYKEKIIGVLFATVSAKTQAESLLVDNFESEGSSAIFNRDGEIILNEIGINEDHAVNNINQFKFENNLSVEDMQSVDTGVSRFYNEQGEEWYFVYTKMNIEDWFVFCVVPASVVSSQLNQFITLAALSWFTVAIIFTMIMYYINTSNMKNKKEMDILAYYDTLVKHDNYRQFALNIQSVLKDEVAQLRYALLEFDVCDFKLFNELYGYQMGDELLLHIMKCIQADMRKDEYCARISADCFVLLWQERDKVVINERVAHVRETIRKDFAHQLDGVNLNFHVGVYLLEGREIDVAKNHDRTTYAKNMLNEDHGDAIAFFSKEMYERIVKDRKLENRFEDALINHEFQVYLQPKVHVVDKQIQSAEALVRWQEPSRGLLSPGEFIPLFEKNGSLQKLDMYVVEEVCKWLAKRKALGSKEIAISVNVSRTYIFKKEFVVNLRHLVAQYEVDPKLIELEITENVIFNRVDELKAIINELKHDGFRIAMDDFGSGYSSLNMLKEIPIHVIKLDQAFFQGNHKDEQRSRMIVQGVIELAKILGLEIVAEGIEYEEQVQFLSDKACDFIQGYYFFKPMPIEEFEKLLENK